MDGDLGENRPDDHDRKAHDRGGRLGVARALQRAGHGELQGLQGLVKRDQPHDLAAEHNHLRVGRIQARNLLAQEENTAQQIKPMATAAAWAQRL